MDAQLLMAGGLVFLLALYIGTVLFFKRREEQEYDPKKRRNDEDSTEDIMDFPVAINDWTEELFTERGDRTYWYRLTILLENGESSDYDFYSYNDSLTKEFILEDRFYVNDHELLLVDEAGEHYINRKKIEQIDFLQRRILENQQVKKGEEKPSPKKTNHDYSDFILEDGEIPDTLLKELTSDYSGKRVLEEPKKNIEKARLFTKKKKIKRPFTRKMEAKKADRIFLSVILLILFSGLFALARTFGIGARIETVSTTQNRMTEQMDLQAATIGNDGYPFAMNRFMQSFIDCYIPLSNDSSSMVGRAEQLKNYCNDSISFEEDPSSIKRVLVSSGSATLD